MPDFSYDLAQVNVALPIEPVGSELLSEFVAALAPINALAEASAGFVWRLQGEEGDATSLRGFGDDRLIINMSTWTSVDALSAFVYRSAHAGIMRRRREWFVLMREAFVALWWVPSSHRPTIAEAEARIAHLRAHGPTPFAFTLKKPFPPPGATTAVTAPGDECPA